MTTTRLERSEIISILRERDGDVCMHPDCDRVLDFSITDGPQQPTIDHRFPVSRARAAGWTEDEIWDTSNLDLMHRRCNASKSDRVYLEDGTLPPKPQSRFRYRRQKRAGRPELCDQCDNGHNLFIGEVCANCGCDAQRFPRWAKVRADECEHNITWCWACSIGIVDRTGALEMIMLGGEGGE